VSVASECSDVKKRASEARKVKNLPAHYSIQIYKIRDICQVHGTV
jgi:hypothetical protein